MLQVNASRPFGSTVICTPPSQRWVEVSGGFGLHCLLPPLQQVHKIPGTPYATLNADSDVALPAATTETADSFKARMERLKDMSSTNLYMEGLPLSIDEPTLQALVNPYRIMSSRFFQTRLSNPPRIIAFVR